MATSRCEGFLMFWKQTPSPSSGYAGGLVTPELMIRCPTLHCVYLLGKWPTWCTNSFLCIYFCL